MIIHHLQLLNCPPGKQKLGFLQRGAHMVFFYNAEEYMVLRWAGS